MDIFSAGIGILAPEVDVLIWFGSSVMASEEYRRTMYRRYSDELEKLENSNGSSKKQEELKKLVKKYAPESKTHKPQNYYFEQRH